MHTVLALLFFILYASSGTMRQRNTNVDMEISYDHLIRLLAQGELETKNKKMENLSPAEVEKYITIMEELFPASKREGIKISDRQLVRISNTLAELNFRKGKLLMAYIYFHGMVIALERYGTKADLHNFIVEYYSDKKTEEYTSKYSEYPKSEKEESKLKLFLRKVFSLLQKPDPKK